LNDTNPVGWRWIFLLIFYCSAVDLRGTEPWEMISAAALTISCRFGRGSAISAPDLEAALGELDERLHVGMQVLEDALCNWQKSPAQFVSFRG
jgi:hypothetical protein